tara:strand:- start:184 stop:1329 length:1146 start_codon:yes stop_codon:yes gene_type:complete
MDNKDNFKEDFADVLNKSKDVLNKSKQFLSDKWEDYLNAPDHNYILRENSRLDKLLKRDPYQYMRLHGTEKSFYKVKGAVMYKKDENGEYQGVANQNGYLVFTTRRLTFSILSKRASYSTYVPLYGRWNYIHKERDSIIYSIPNFLLTGSYIKGDFDNQFTGFLKKDNPFVWEIRNEGVKFEFFIEEPNEEMQETINWLMNMPTEILISYMKFRFNDTDLYPNWEWEVDEKKNPKKDKKLESEERIKLLDELLDDYGYYWFYGRSKPKEEIEKILKNKKLKLNQASTNKLIQEESPKDNSLAYEERLEIKSEEKDLNLEEEPKIKSSIESPPTKKILDSKNTTEEAQTSSLAEELEKLVSLKEKGLLTEEEFVAAKTKLLK